jgi:HSP20 family protein
MTTTRRWDPLRDLLTLQERMNRLFEGTLSATSRTTAPPLDSGSWVPLADVYETEEGFVAHVDLPGLKSDDVEVHVEGDRLVLRGQRRPSEKTRPDIYHRMERSYGPFSRTFILAPDVDPDRVTATFKDGLLRLDLPKTRPRPPWRNGPDRGETG